MSKIKSKNTKPEIIVRKFLFSKGLRFRLHARYLPGKPDIVLPKYKTVIFVNGCFWHGHQGCKYYVTPKTNTEKWCNKIEKNKINDNNVILELTEKNWQPIVVWECELKRGKKLKALDDIYNLITSNS